ncbi:substrate-binding periplasmic protein [Vannielia litorea]|uniref:substrate-binding periplasmic protein n=1 Tax=Vannielia litorea TaxID=1217970 RepID=UPI001BCCDDE2|nr:transporter substrate-binding domain-containing protein [Vannielia litorea]MBS8225138.1 amino acid ABC transporter substrate-binding protein [Vannielia litorea]
MQWRLLLGAFLLAGLAAPLPARAEDPCADYIPQPKPQNTGRDVVGQDLDTIIERGFITFALYADNPPYSWKDGSTPRGVDVEIARLIAEELGVEPRFDFFTAGENLQADLRNTLWKGAVIGGRISNVMLRVPYNSAFKCRVEQVVFTGQYAEESIAIAYSTSVYPDEGPTVPYFRFDPVGVENDSISDFYLSGFAGGQLAGNIRHFATTGAALEALAAGEVAAVMGPLGQLEHGVGEGMAIHAPPLPGFAVGTWTLGVGVHFAYRPLGYAVDDAIYAGLEDGRIEAIYARYGMTLVKPER